MPRHPVDDLGHYLRVGLPQGAIDLDVAVVAVRLVTDQAVGAQQAAEAAAIGAGGRLIILLVDDQP